MTKEELEQMYQDCDLQRGKLMAEVARLTAERYQARYLFESADLQRGRLISEVARLRKALGEIASDNTFPDDMRDIAIAALEGE